MTRDVWERRLSRAAALEERWPFAAEVLRFFRAVTGVQREIHQHVSAAPDLDLRRLEPALLLPFVTPMLRRMSEAGPEPLAETVDHLQALPADEWARLLQERWVLRDTAAESLAALIPEALLHPYAMAAATRWGEVGGHVTGGRAGGPRRTCPFCDGPPLVSLLREEKDAGSVVRALVCARCASEWRHPRVLCPSCGEEEPEKLPRYQAEEFSWVRVEGCDSCKRYLKVVDLTQDPEADPQADEIGATPLDIHAAELEYTKLARNLIGV